MDDLYFWGLVFPISLLILIFAVDRFCEAKKEFRKAKELESEYKRLRKQNDLLEGLFEKPKTINELKENQRKMVDIRLKYSAELSKTNHGISILKAVDLKMKKNRDEILTISQNIETQRDEFIKNRL